MSRRDFGGVVGAPLLQTGGSRPSCAVIGAGVFGSWIAYRLRQSGHEVTLVDTWGAGNSRSSSGGETRIIRAAYGPDEIYSRMAVYSLAQWKALAAATGRTLFQPTGVLWLALPDTHSAIASRTVLRKIRVPFEEISNADLGRRYPQIRCSAQTTAIFEPDSGALMARQAVAAVAAEFVRAGGRFVQGAIAPQRITGPLSSLRLVNGETIKADVFVFACGAWMAKLFPDLLGNRIFPTRQEVLFFGLPPGDSRFSAPRMPVWIDFSDNRQMYGFPDIERRGFKIAFDAHGPAIDPDSEDRLVTQAKIAQARVYLADRFPDLARMPVIESRVCQYENTSNGDFLLDRHPAAQNVWLAGGGSGHGFKHGPAVGEYVAARIGGASTPAVEPRFSLASKGTEQQRAVY